MRWWDRLKTELRSVMLGPYALGDPALTRLFGGGPTASGEPVSEPRVAGLPVAWRCLNLLAGTVSAMPLVVYRREDDSRTKYREHPLFSVLGQRPNPAMGAAQFWEFMTLALLLRGNAYASIVRDDDGRVRALWPLHSDRVQPDLQKNGRLKYRVTAGAQTLTVNETGMLHIVRMSDDGYVGRSVLDAARETFGLALGERQYVGEVFGNGLSPRGTLTAPGRLSKEARDHLKQSLEDNHTGRGKRHRTLVLEEGLKFEPIGLTHEDAELIESRKYTGVELAMLFGCPPHLVGLDVRSSVYSNASYEALSLLKFTLAPILSAIEGACNHSLVSPLERNAMYCEFLPDSLLAADTKGRYEAYQLGVAGGWLTIDEIRAKENLPALAARMPTVA